MSRSLNFSDQELDVLLTFLESSRQLVTKEFGGTLSSAHDYKKGWEDLSELVNSVCCGTRKTD